ncbi:MAG: hypothetical protein PWP38_2641 [Clostridiales bacterium]|nr:hypothetical protein [Clostridiales bacterium]
MKKTTYVILGLLSEAPMTGYQIKQVIDIRFKFFWRESYGQIFPTLKAMVESGDINILDIAPQNNRAQKTYAITPQGTANLKTWLSMPVETEMVRLELLLKMYFGNLADREAMQSHLAAFQAAHQSDLDQLNAFSDEVTKLLDQDENHPMVLSVIDFGQKVNRAYLAWVEAAQKLFSEGDEADAAK